MAKGTGTKGGVLKQKEKEREARTNLKGSADSLQSVDKNLKKLTKGISSLNANVMNIKVIEAANLAFDIKTAVGAKGISEKIDARVDEMSARNEAGLHDISKGIGKLHSLFTGEDKDQAEARQSRIRKERKDSLFKHRKMLSNQKEFLKKKGKLGIADLDKKSREEWDKDAATLSQKHREARPYNLDNIGSLVGGGSGSGSGSGSGGTGTMRAFAGLLKNTDTTNIKLDEVIEILRGDHLLRKENKREGKKDKHKFSKTSRMNGGAAIGGIGALLGVAGGLFGAGAIKKLWNKFTFKPNVATTTTAKTVQTGQKYVPEKEKLRIEKERKAKIEADKKTARLEKERVANEKKVQLEKERVAKEKLKLKNQATNNFNKATNKTPTKTSTTSTPKAAEAKSAIKKYLKKASIKDLKSWLNALKGVSSISKAKALFAWNPAGWLLLAAVFVAEAVAVNFLYEYIQEELEERAAKELAANKTKTKGKQSRYTEEYIIAKDKSKFTEIVNSDVAAWRASSVAGLAKFNSEADQTNQMLGKDWYTKPEHAATYEQFQGQLRRAVTNYTDSHSGAPVNTSNVVNSGNTSNNNQTINNFGVPGNAGGVPGL